MCGWLHKWVYVNRVNTNVGLEVWKGVGVQVGLHAPATYSLKNKNKRFTYQIRSLHLNYNKWVLVSLDCQAESI